jgi:hypothetical protein
LLLFAQWREKIPGAARAYVNIKTARRWWSAVFCFWQKIMTKLDQSQLYRAIF